MHLVGIGEMWRRIFSNIVLKVTVPEASMAFQDDQMCAGLKAVINGEDHGVQAIWDKNLTMEDWGFLLVDANNFFTEIIESEFCGRSDTYGRPELGLSLIAIVTGRRLFCRTGMGKTVFCIVRRA